MTAPTETPQHILTEVVDEHILVVTMNRPEARNAFNADMSAQMQAAMDRYADDPSLWVCIIRGEGPTFSAGMDLKAAAKGDFGKMPARGGFGILFDPPQKPLIAAVDGSAFAGGFENALSCDLIVAADNSTFGLPETKWSLIAIGGGVLRLPQRLPYHIAMEMILTARPKPVQELAPYGLVNRVVAPGQCYAAALDLARLILANAPLAVQGSKRIVHRSIAEQWPFAQGLTEQRAEMKQVAASADYRQGVTSFAEKRASVWTGS